MSFVLYRRPGGVVFLDDEPDYLEMLAEVMPADCYVRLFAHPADCHDYLKEEVMLWDADTCAQQRIITRWHEGASLISQVLSYWRENGNRRFGLTQICIVDYSLPAMSGLDVLSRLSEWPGVRVLLTGRADEQIAVSAFNRGLIDLFLPKQSPELRLRLVSAIQNLPGFLSVGYQQTWRATMTHEQLALLRDEAISHMLQSMALKHGWVEHVVIGAPFGVLALDSRGHVNWLQLETGDKLSELAEMAEVQGWSASIVQDIRSGKKTS